MIDKNDYLWIMEKYYRHFKGNVYKLVGIAKDSETLEEMVVYQAMYGEGQLWLRPKEEFFGKVERDGREMDRFEMLNGKGMFPDIEYTDQKLPLTLGEFSRGVLAMITLLQKRRIVPLGFFQGLHSDDELEDDALRRIRNYQDGETLESIFHLIQTWGGSTGRGVYVRGNGFDWSVVEPAYRELVESCLSVRTLTADGIAFLSSAVKSFNQNVRHMGVSFITKHTRFWLHKSLGEQNALPIYDNIMASFVMGKDSALCKDLAEYWTEMTKEAQRHQVGLVPFERQLFRYFTSSRMTYKGFSFKYYHGEQKNPFEKNGNAATWWSGEKLFYESISREDGERFINGITRDYDDALSHNILKGKLLDRSIPKKDHILLFYLDLWHGKWFPYDNLDEIRNY
jgi:hypothetical protein